MENQQNINKNIQYLYDKKEEHENHIPVLFNDLKKFFQKISPFIPKGFLVDGTFGRGGHSSLIYDSFQHLPLLVFDQDLEAKKYAEQKKFLEKQDFFFFWEPFSSLEKNVKDTQQKYYNHNFENSFAPDFPETPCSLIFLDLGVSSPQLDQAERGFSFQKSGPLDMRMNCQQDLRAQDIINNYSQESLGDIFYYYGQEHHSRFFANLIIENRPFYDTLELANCLKNGYYRKYGHYENKKNKKEKIHPATRIFQSLRIAVNNELGELSSVLDQGIKLLAPGGFFIVISFHSLEDSLVKKAFRSSSGETSKKPLEPNEEEMRNNPRSRSAKWRWFKKSS